MDKYRVYFMRSNDEFAEIVVSANSPEEAEEAAGIAAENGELIPHKGEEDNDWQMDGSPPERVASTKFNYD